jgi:hypothetical protein
LREKQEKQVMKKTTKESLIKNFAIDNLGRVVIENKMLLNKISGAIFSSIGLFGDGVAGSNMIACNVPCPHSNPQCVNEDC